MEQKKNLVYLDILNTIACLMVVFFHCNGIFYEYSDTVSWKISVVDRCIVFSAIPVFFMLTGAKLFEYRNRYSTYEFIKKRLLRTGIPFVFWNVFYIFYNMLLLDKSYKSPSQFISAFLNSEIQGRYWFFFPLFAIYAAIPIISLLLKIPEHRKYLWYLVGVSFGFSWVLRPILTVLGIKYNSYFDFPLADGFLTFSVFGYLVYSKPWNKKARLLLYFCTLLSEIFVILYTCVASAKAGETVQFFVNYAFFPSALMGASIFVFFRHLNTEKLSERFKKIAHTLAECNMGIWLTHSACITLLVVITKLTLASYIFRFACPFLIYLLCFAGTWVAKKIPFIKYLV